MRYFAICLSLFAISFSMVTQAESTVVGKVNFSKGSNAAQQSNGQPRLLGKDSEIYQGDNIQTCEGSFVIVEFKDGSKVTIRPNSNFKIEQFDSANKSAKLTVYEGGVKASTGDFAKAGADNFQIKTPTATLKGAQDSEYSIKVCKENCETVSKEAKKDNSVAKVVDVKGIVMAKNRSDNNADERKLATGSDLSPQDFLTSQADSYAVMVFRDGQKITIQPNSEFDIVEYNFQQPGKKDQMAFKLVTGGMRALTGSIGKKDHDAYKLDTPVATIGIRGTESETIIDNAVDVNTGSAPVYNHVTEGSISVKNEAGETTLAQGQSSVTSSPTAPTMQVPSLPSKVSEQINSTPSPKAAPDPDKAFDAKPTNAGKAAATIAVNKGSGTVASKNDDDKKTDKTEKNSSSSKSSDGAKNESKAAPVSTSNNSDSGGGKSTSSNANSSATSGTVLTAGQSLTSSEAGESKASSEIPADIAQEFASTPSPASAASGSTSAFTESAGSGGSCAVQ
jgi:hypothetical protein